MPQFTANNNAPIAMLSPSLGFAFWNLNKKPVAGLLRQLVDEHDIDIVILAENGIDKVELLEVLNRNQPRTYLLDTIPAKKITLLTRLPYGAVLPISDEMDLSVRHLVPPVGDSLLLVSAHFRRIRITLVQIVHAQARDAGQVVHEMRLPGVVWQIAERLIGCAQGVFSEWL